MLTEGVNDMSSKSDAVRFLEDLAGGPLTIGRLIQSIRLGEEQSLETFAARLGVARTNLSDIEQGRRGVSLTRAYAWAGRLGYDQRQFVELALQQQLDTAGIKYRASVADDRAGFERGKRKRAARGRR